MTTSTKRPDGGELTLGPFNHHPDPAIDFCIEVEVIEAEWLNIRHGFTNGTPPRSEIVERLTKAMRFRVGGDQCAVNAKTMLRKIEAEMSATPTNESPAPQPPVEGLREALTDILAHLAAAISLLERTPAAKKAAPSNKMFDQMLADYHASLERGRAALASTFLTAERNEIQSSDVGVEGHAQATAVYNGVKSPALDIAPEPSQSLCSEAGIKPGPSEARLSAPDVREACAVICDEHAAWAESKITGDPASHIFATISNTANDCAEMIRNPEKGLGLRTALSAQPAKGER
jgi:hypothetical protein